MLKHTPIKQQRQATKQQRVENMVDDLWLPSDLSIFQSVGGFQRLTTVK